MEKIAEAPRSNSKSVEPDEISSRQVPVYPTGWRLALILAALLFGTLLVAIDNTIIGVAVPKITTDFRALDDVGWYSSAYLIAVTALQPSYGNIYKFFHVKLTYLAAIVIFEGGSVLCAAAPSSVSFIIGRAVAGIGAAGILQGALGFITLIAPLQKRPLYFSIVLSVFALAVCVGPILGGVITDHLSWRWCFWINLPIGGLAFALVVIFIRLKGHQNRNRDLPMKTKLRHMDGLGALMLISAVTCLLLALQWGNETGDWRSSRVIGLFVGFVGLTAAFILLQWKLEERATIPLRILGQRSVLMGCLFIAFLDMTAYTYAYYLSFYFQGAQGVSATQSGVRYTPLVIPQIVAIIISGAIVTKFGFYVPFMIMGPIIAVVGTGLLTRVEPDTLKVEWATFLGLTGLGLGLGMQQPYTAVQSDVPTGNGGCLAEVPPLRRRITDKNVINVYIAITVFLQQLGGALSVPLGATIFLHRLSQELPRHTDLISADELIRAGATNLPSLTTDPVILHALRVTYARAVGTTLYFAVGTTALAIPFACGMEWKNVAKISRKRRQGAELAADLSPPSIRRNHSEEKGREEEETQNENQRQPQEQKQQ